MFNADPQPVPQQSRTDMKPQVLQLNPILIPAVNDELASRYQVHKFFEIPDQAAWLREHGAGIEAVITATLGALTEDVADLAIGLLIAACRNLCAGDRFVREGLWEQFPSPSAIPLARRFSGMRVGIVGMGRVGRAVATRAAAFGCQIRYTDLRAMDDLPHEFVPDLIELARRSDALVLSAAADKAEGIVNAKVLDALGPRGFLVNVARGRLVNEADLTEALVAGRIAGAGLDVFVDEPRVPAALRQSDRTTLQAHRASATWETRAAMGQMVLDSIAQALAGERPSMSLTT